MIHQIKLFLLLIFCITWTHVNAQSLRVFTELREVWTDVGGGDCSSCDGLDMTWTVDAALYKGTGSLVSNTACVHMADGPSRKTWHSRQRDLINYTSSSVSLDLCDKDELRFEYFLRGWENDCSSSCSYESSCSSWGGGDDSYKTVNYTYLLSSLNKPGSNNAQTITKSWGDNKYKVRLRVWYKIINAQPTISAFASDGQTVLPDVVCEGSTVVYRLNPNSNYSNGHVYWQKFQNGSWSNVTNGVNKYTLEVTANPNISGYRARTQHKKNNCIGEFTTDLSEDIWGESGTLNIVEKPPTQNNVTFTSAQVCEGSNDGSMTISIGNGFDANDVFNMTLQEFDGNIWIFNDGALSVNGSDFPYTFSGKSPGKYRATLTRVYQGDEFTADANCTVISKEHVLREVAYAELSDVSSQNVRCFGENNGFISTVVTNNASSVTLEPASTQIEILGTINSWGRVGFNNLGPDTYTLRAYNSIGCIRDTTVVVLEAAEELTMFAEGILIPGTDLNIACFDSSGSVFMSALGGQGPYTFRIGPYNEEVVQDGNRTFDNLGPYSYTAFVIDSFGCIVDTTLMLTQPETSVEVDTLRVMNSAACTNIGEIDLTATGGSGPYEFKFGTGPWSEIDTIANLASGTYRVFARDTLNCVSEKEFQITEAGQLMLDLVDSPVTCADTVDGSIQATVMGGNAPYTFVLTLGPDTLENINQAGTTYNFQNLLGGEYEVRVTDMFGCAIVSNLELFEPQDLKIESVTVRQPSCMDDNSEVTIFTSGRATGAVSGEGIFVQFDSDPTMYFAEEVSGGDDGFVKEYFIASGPSKATTMTINMENADCPAINQPYTLPEVINNPTELVFDDITTTDVSCNGGSDGILTVQFSGGRGPYEVELQAVTGGLFTITIEEVITSEDSVTFINLPTGYEDGNHLGYNVIVRDGQDGPANERCNINLVGGGIEGCIGCAEIREPEALMISIANTGNGLNCARTNGELTITTIGGTAPYMYSTDSVSFQFNNVLTGLGEGPSVYVLDTLGCAVQNPDTIIMPIAPIPLEFSERINLEPITECTPLIDSILMTGVEGPMTVELINVVVIEESVFDVAAPLISIEVIDSAFIVNSEYTGIDDWGPGDEIQMTFTVSDSASCSTTFTYEYNVPSQMNLEVINHTGENCLDSGDGSFTLQVTNGQAPYKYLLNLTDTMEISDGSPVNFDNLVSGAYLLTVIDDFGCKFSLIDTIGVASPISVKAVVGAPLACAEDSTGSLTLSVSGGIAPYSVQFLGNFGENQGPPVLLNDGESTVLNNLPSTEQSMLITDNNGCVVRETVTYPGPSSIQFLPIDTILPACDGANDGELTFRMLGGTGALMVSLDGGMPSTDTVFSGLAGGHYFVQITDENGCVADTGFTLPIPNAINIDISTIDVDCFGDASGSIEVSATGGAGGFTYALNGGTFQSENIFTGLGGGMYMISVQDAAGCIIDTMNLTVAEPSEVIATPIVVQENGCGQLGILTVSVVGGMPPYFYNWDDGVSVNDTLFDTGPGAHQVIVTDAVGCFDTAFFFLTDIPDMMISLFESTPSSCLNNDGSATIVVDSGTGPFDLSWDHDDMLSDSIATGLSPGTYSVTATDANGCQDSLEIIIGIVDSPNASVSQTTPSFCGQMNGSATVGVTGGMPPLNFEWSHDINLNDPIAMDLDSGSYEVVVIDINGCTDTVQFDIIEVDSPTLQLDSITNETCDLSNGSIVVESIGGNGPFIYNWNHSTAIIGPEAINLESGTYSVTVTDVNGCQDSLINIIVNNTPGVQLDLAEASNNSCAQGNGFIVTMPTGGTMPYTFIWSHDAGVIDSFATDLDAGIYSVIVTDAQGCMDTVEVEIFDEPLFAIDSAETTSPGCGLENGMITINVSGGNMPYIYAWSHADTLNGATATSLGAGNYLVTVTDATGCAVMSSIDLSESDGPIASILMAENSTCGLTNGNIVLAVVGGLPPYNYEWNHDNLLNDSIAIMLPAGNYSVTISDANNCSDVVSVVLTESPAAEVNLIEAINETCGQGNGSIELNADAGTPGFTYQWSHNGSITGPGAENLSAGDYTITMTDALGCMDTIDISIINIPGPSVTVIDSSDNYCGSSNGYIFLGVTDGTPPYSYAWDHDAGLTDSIAMNLAAGTYTTTVTDANNCTVEISSTISDQPFLEISIIDILPSSCSAPTGSISALATGGLGTYMYSWSHDAGLNSASATDLAPGEYTVYVTDSLGCIDSISATILQEDAPILDNVQVVDALCGDDVGSITLFVSAGESPYAYTWSHDAGLTDSIASDLSAGPYSVTISGSNGCSIDTLILIEATGAPTVNVDTIIHPTCQNNDGSITISGVGGQPPYTYEWYDATAPTILIGTNSTIADLPAGQYLGRIIDANGCTGETLVTLIDVAGPSASIFSIANTSCGLENGSVTLQVSGGTPPYSFSWSHDILLTDSVAINLANDSYTVTVSDANNCTDIINLDIEDSSAPLLSIVNLTNETCGKANGAITIATTGGLAPYSYEWNHNASLLDSIANNLPEGNYSVIVTDANNCKDTIDISIINLDGPQITLASSGNNSCESSNGFIVFAVNMGTVPYSFAWNHDPTLTDSMAQNLAAGTYTMTVTDANSCTAELSATIANEELLNVQLVLVTESACAPPNGYVEVMSSGGAGTFSYQWSHDVNLNSPIATGLNTGNYTVFVTDTTGCMDSLIVFVPEASRPTIDSVQTEDASCASDIGTITLFVSNGNPPYSYNWQHDINLSDSIATNLASGLYSVTLTDAKNCSIDTLILIQSTDAPVINVENVTNPGCDLMDGSITVSATGGTPGYTFEWFETSDLNTVIGNNPTISGIGAGTYLVRVTDTGGCVGETLVELIEPNGPAASLLESDIAACGESIGFATIITSDGMMPYSFSWSHDEFLTDSIAAGLSAGIYSVTITDANNCMAEVIVEILGTPEAEIHLVTTENETCDLNNGSIEVEATLGTGPFTFSWSHDAGLTGPIAINLTSGEYQVILIDANSCMDTIDISLDSLPEIDLIVLDSMQNSCSVGNGAITLGTIDGAAPFIFEWSHDAALADSIATDLIPGIYTATVTDANGCTAEVSSKIIDEDLLTIFIESTTMSACDPFSGSIDVGASGGIGDYTFNWSHDILLTGDVATDLGPGLFTIYVTDESGCLDSVDTTIELKESPSINGATVINALCGDDVGSIDVNVTGGSLPYIFSWSHDGSIDISMVSNLAAGLYSVTITDANGCTADTLILIETTNGPSAVAGIIVSPSCEMANGSISIIGSDGEEPYSYEWENLDNVGIVIGMDSELTDVTAGSYLGRVIDWQGCFAEVIVTISDEPDMVLTTSTSPVTCFGDGDGTSTVIITSGGIAPFSYLWNDDSAQATATATGLSAGIYTVSVTDNRGCLQTAFVEIISPDSITIDTVEITLPSCPGDSDAFVEISVNGGTEPYQITWYGPTSNQSGVILSGVPAADYILEIRDANNCIVELDFSIDDPDSLTLMAGNIVSPSCVGNIGGSLEVLVERGTSPYFYLWNDPMGQTGATATDLETGAYTVTVTDANNCSATLQMEVPEGETLEIELDSLIQPLCQGDQNGGVNVTMLGGSGNYSYQWDDINFQITEDATQLETGTYQLFVSDLTTGCTAMETFELLEPEAIDIVDISTVDVTCFNLSDGEVTISNIAGGAPPYTYLWNDPLNQTTSTATQLAIGQYTVTVTDANNCTSTANAFISGPDPFTITEVINVSPACNAGSDGMAQIMVDGGDGNLTIQWLDINILGQSADNLTAGEYEISITDGNGCDTIYTLTIEEPEPVLLTAGEITPPECSGGIGGSLTVEVEDGTPNYSFLWSDPLGQITQTAFDLETGIYTVTVTDANGCSETLDMEVPETPGLTITLDAEVLPTCHGLSNGSLSVSTTGGYNDYVYLWNDPAFQTTPTAINLMAGQYTVEVRNGDGSCVTLDTFILDQPDTLSLVNDNVVDATCYSVEDGIVNLDISGGTPDYTFNWADFGNDLGPAVINLGAGNYDVEVLDANGCSLNTTIVVNQPDSILISANVVEPECFDNTDGSIDLMVSGGNDGYNYLWADPISSDQSMISNLVAGTYMVEVTDQNGCSNLSSFELTTSGPFEFTLAGNGDTTICAGQNLLIGNEAILGQTYSWSGPDGFDSDSSIVGITEAGQYIMTVVNGSCTASDTIDIFEFDEALQALFIIPTQVVVNDSVIALEVSWPVPDAVAWSYDMDSVLFLGTNDNQAIFQFPFEGSFEIGMTAVKGNCLSELSKTIDVFADSSEIEIPIDFGNKQILSMSLAPNPNSGVFALDFELNQLNDYRIEIFDIDGGEVEVRSGNGQGALKEMYNLDLLPGIYALILSSGLDQASVVFVVE